jgi:hypothetical protein
MEQNGRIESVLDTCADLLTKTFEESREEFFTRMHIFKKQKTK